VLVVVVLALTAAPAEAMAFRLLQSPNGVRSVVATGEIVPGDARRLERALGLASRQKNGTKALLLASPGGSVAEALAMANVMDRVGVSVTIPAHAICASACASVLFVSGKYRSIDKGGGLLVHSCFDDRTGRKVDGCDLYIAAHAQQEGASGLAMMALQEAAGTNAAFLMNQAGAACFGLTRRAGHANPPTPPCIAAALRAHRRYGG
jgi:hypothetical protein